MYYQLLTVLLSFQLSTSLRIPAYVGRFGSLTVNASIPGTFFENRTMPLRVTLDSQTTIGHPRVPLGGVLVHMDRTNMSLIDPNIYYHGGIGPESTLAIGRDSYLRNRFGPVAFTQNELVLNSNRTEFVSTCSAGSYMGIPMNGTIHDQWDGTILAEGFEFVVSFKLNALPSGIIGAFPRETGNSIRRQMIANGAVVENRRTFRGIREDVMTNCSAESTLTGLPDVVLSFTGVGALVLTPEDYIYVDEVNRECLLRFKDPAPATVGGYFVFNPLDIQNLNVRVSDDLLEICDATTA